MHPQYNTKSSKMRQPRRMYLSTAAKDPAIFTENALCKLLEIPPFYDPDTSDGLYDDNEEYIDERVEFSYAYDKGWEQHRDNNYTRSCDRCNATGTIGDDDEVECPVCKGETTVDVTWDDWDKIRDTPEWKAARDEVERELLNCWERAADAAIDWGIEDFELECQPIVLLGREKDDMREQRGFILRPIKDKTWKDVCEALVETINGVGYFWFDDAKALRDSGPYKSYKEAAAAHFHWMKDRGRVYDHRTPEQIYRDNLRHTMANW